MSQLPCIPNDLVYEILLKLPVTSLLRFKSVCKSWKNLISNPQFVTNHLHTGTFKPHHQRLASFVYGGRNKILTCSVQSLFENPSTPTATITFEMDRKYYIIGSINGLLCLRDRDGCFKLWNPSTRFESKTSPPIWCRLRHAILFGFGYDQVNNKYKVVVYGYDSSGKVTKVYTFGTDSWVTLDSRTRIEDYPIRCFSKLGKFTSGTLNWLTPSMILSFDMENETYGEVPLPSQPRPDDGDHGFNYEDLDILNNCLAVCDDSHPDHWVVWLMKKYGVRESWTKLMVIPHENYIQPLCILENGLVLARGRRFLLLHNRNNGESQQFDILGRFGRDTQVYHESLVTP